jgi:hypothetical protein
MLIWINNALQNIQYSKFNKKLSQIVEITSRYVIKSLSKIYNYIDDIVLM